MLLKEKEIMSKDKIGALTRVAVGIKHEYHGIALDVLNRLNSGDASAWAGRFAEVVQQGLPSSEVYLRKISGDVTIPATTGARTIAQAKKTFPGYIDSDFANWGLNVPSPSTPDTSVEVHEQVKDGTFATIFGSLGKNLDDLCFTQGQNISFVEVHPELLHPEGYGTFFLFKVNGEYFVAGVDRRSGGRLQAYVYRFSFDDVWYAEYRSRFVFPQLGTSDTQS